MSDKPSAGSPPAPQQEPAAEAAGKPATAAAGLWADFLRRSLLIGSLAGGAAATPGRDQPRRDA